MKNIIEKILMKFSYILSMFTKNKDIKFIYYHDVVLQDGYSYQKIEIEKFLKQMKYLSEHGYKAIVFNDMDESKKCNLKDKEKLVLITFDDGWISNYNIVFPIMKELGMKFNIFLEVGAINKNQNYLTWDMVNEMKESGLVGFGAHTFNHVDARLINESNIDVEIHKANREIYNKTGLVVNDFCFPFGYYDNKIISLLDDINVYKRLYISDGRRINRKNTVDLIGRIGIEDDDNKNMFIAKLEGRYNLYYYAVNRIKNLIRGDKR